MWVLQMGHCLLLRTNISILIALHVAIVMFDARLAVLVQTLPHVFGRVIHRCADLAQQSLVLDALEQVVGHRAVVFLGE